MERNAPDPSSDARYCVELLRSEDRDRLLAAQFAPVGARERLLALLAVNAEIARVVRLAREPVLRRVRVQWWRESLAGVFHGRPPSGQPALRWFACAHGQTPFDRDMIERLLAAGERDFAAEPLTRIDEAVIQAESASGSLARLALQTLGVVDPMAVAAARSAGIALGLVEMIGRVPFAVEMSAREHIAAARGERANVPEVARAVMLWATAAEARLNAADPARSPPLLPLTLAWRAWRRAY